MNKNDITLDDRVAELTVDITILAIKTDMIARTWEALHSQGFRPYGEARYFINEMIIARFAQRATELLFEFMAGNYAVKLIYPERYCDLASDRMGASLAGMRLDESEQKFLYENVISSCVEVASEYFSGAVIERGLSND